MIETLKLADWKACLSANLDGAFMLCSWAAAHMKAQKSGSIILMSSTAGLFGYPNRSPYGTSKWGVIGLMKALACELGPYQVRVNAICPGAVEGDRMERVLDMESSASGVDREHLRKSLRKRCIDENMGKYAGHCRCRTVFNVPAASKISGLALPVDGHTETINP